MYLGHQTDGRTTRLAAPAGLVLQDVDPDAALFVGNSCAVRAREHPSTPYILVIDEINRANLAKV